MTKINTVYQDTLFRLLDKYDYVSSPCGEEIKELINATIEIPLISPLVSVDSADLSYPVLFWSATSALAAEDLTKVAWGIMEPDSFRFYQMTSRVGDLLQFIVRNGELHLTATLPCLEASWELPSDIFIYAMLAKGVQCLLEEQGMNVALGTLTVNIGVLYLEEAQYRRATTIAFDDTINQTVLPYAVDLLKVRDINDLADCLRNYSKTYYANCNDTRGQPIPTP